MKFRPFLAPSLCGLLVACQSATKSGSETEPKASLSAAVTGASKEGWVRSEVFFAIAPAEAEGLGLSAAEATWRAFLDEEVTPRFPEGFTLIDGNFQRRENAGAPIQRERGKVLVMVHRDTPANRAGVEALCEAYKNLTGAKSVLVVETLVRAPCF